MLGRKSICRAVTIIALTIISITYLTDYFTDAYGKKKLGKMNPLRMTVQTTRIAGHRGNSAVAPENTISAFRKAHELGGRGVTCETDLALTRDGEFVLIHDKTVDRTTNGQGLVSNMTYSEIAKLDAGSWFDESFAGERIPLLRDALLLARQLGIIYQLELKIYDQNEVIFPKLRSLIDELDCADLLQFSSFDFLQLREVKKVIPEVPTVGISHSRSINPAALAREANLDAVNIEIQHFPSGEAYQLHKEGFAAFLYIPEPKRLEKLKSYGGMDVEAKVVDWVREGLLDQIISNDVAQMARIMHQVRGA
jgi:glycerophosphoryl diester phosphodiesterase